MPEIVDFAVAANHDGLLEIVAIAQPVSSDEEFPGGVWHSQQTAAPIHGDDEWTDHWRSLGRSGSWHRRSGISIEPNADGRLEVAVLNTAATMWHAWQVHPDGDWSTWNSLGNPVHDITMSSPALARNQDGRLELFAAICGPTEFAVWHRRQKEPGHGPWEPWHSLGYPGSVRASAEAPTLARNQDGRLELFIESSGEIWHCWQTAANNDDWSPWRSLKTPDAQEAYLGWPALARDKDGRLMLFAASGGSTVWYRRQHEPGHGPWEPWTMLGPQPPLAVPKLAVGAQADGRLILFAVRRAPQGSMWLQQVEQTAPDGEWAQWEAIDTGLLGEDSVPTVDDPTLVTDGQGRLRLFFRIPGQAGMYILNQADPNGSLWLEEWQNFSPPRLKPSASTSSAG